MFPGDFQLIFGRFNSSSPVEQFPISIPPPLPPPAVLTPNILAVSPSLITHSLTSLAPSPAILSPNSCSLTLTPTILSPSLTPSLPSLPASPAPLDFDPQPSLIDYTHPTSYITSLQTQNIKLQPIDLTPEVVTPSTESTDADELISKMISNIFSGCDNESGGYDMWANFTPNENKHNFPSVRSSSFFTSTESPSVPQSEGGGRIRRKRLIKSVLSAMNKIVYKYNTKESCPDPVSDSFISDDELNNRNTHLKTLLEKLNKNSGKLESWQIEKPESHEDERVNYFGQDFDNCQSYLPQYEPSRFDTFQFDSAVKKPTLDFPEIKSDPELDYAKDFPKPDFPDLPKINDVKPLDYSKILKRKFDSYRTTRTVDTTETPQTSSIIPASEVLQFPPYNFPPLEPTRAASPFPVPVVAPPIPQWLIHTTPPNLNTVMRITNIGSNTVNTSSYSSTNLNFGYNSNCWKNSPPPPGLESPDPVWVNWLSKPNTVISPTTRWDASIPMNWNS